YCPPVVCNVSVNPGMQLSWTNSDTIQLWLLEIGERYGAQPYDRTPIGSGHNHLPELHLFAPDSANSHPQDSIYQLPGSSTIPLAWREKSVTCRSPCR